MATIAVFLALGGGAYAAATVGSAQVVNDSLKSVDLNNADGVRSVDVRDDVLTGGGLAAPDLAPNSVGSSEVATNALGGGDIDESSLGIPGRASRVEFTPSGCTGTFASPSAGCQSKVLDAPGGLDLTATCYRRGDPTGGSTETDQALRLDATTPTGSSTSWVYHTSLGGNALLGEALGGSNTIFNVPADSSEFEIGTMVYRHSGNVVTLDFHGREAFNGTCEFFANALAGA
jgi:hypothetical protein